MGWVSDLAKSFTGSKQSDAAQEAAGIQAGQYQQIIDMQKPFVDAGVAQLDPLADSATAQGYGQNIGDLLNGGALAPLIKERQDAATNYFAARGLRRSGAAGREAANIPTDLSMQIESELNRRRQSLAGVGQSGVNSSSGALEGIGASLAGGQLGAAQASTNGVNNMIKIASLFMGKK